MKLPLKTIIVEDREDDLALLRYHLSHYSKIISIEKEAMTFKSARNMLLNEQFDLSLLDIDLDDNDCYELIRQVGQQPFGIIAFSTQSTSVPFEVSKTLPSHLHLPKPYSEDGAILFIRELLEEINRRTKVSSSYRPFESQPPLLLKDARKKSITIEPYKIVYVEVQNSMCSIFTEENSVLKKIIVDIQLNELEEMLSKDLFHRISRQHLVNLKFVESFDGRHITIRGKLNNMPVILKVPEEQISTFKNRFP